MNLKKLLSGALIGAFAFGISAGSLQPVSAASLEDAKKIYDAKDKYDSAKDKYNSAKDKYNSARDKFGSRNSDGQNPPEPPKDADGNPMPPPDRNSDSSDRPEPPRDSDGNILPPPDENKLDGEGSVKFEQPDKNSDVKDRYNKTKDKIDSAKDKFNRAADKLK